MFTESNGTDGATEEKHALKEMMEGVTTLASLSHAATATDVLSPCPICNVPKPSLGATVKGLNCTVCVSTQEHMGN